MPGMDTDKSAATTDDVQHGGTTLRTQSSWLTRSAYVHTNIQSRFLAIIFLLFLFFVFKNEMVARSCMFSLATALASLQRAYGAALTNEGAAPEAKSKAQSWPVQKYMTEDFQAPDMLINKTGKIISGYFFITPKGNGTTAQGPAIMTETNDLIWHAPAGHTDTSNLRIQKLKNGDPVITYWNGTSSATFGHGYGSVQILDATYKQLHRICMKDIKLITPEYETYPCHLDFHESYVTDQNTLIFTAYNVTRYDLRPVGGPKDGWIFDSLFYEVDIDTEEIIFKWSSLDHISEIPLNKTKYPLTVQDTTFGSKQKFPFDYFHINSIQPLRDGYLVNSRHMFAFYKINRKGEIEWKLQGVDGGDFELDPEIRFSWQHQPRVTQDRDSRMRLHLFNNDNSEAHNGTYQTTGLELSLDLQDMYAALDRKLLEPSDQVYAESQGSYQSLDKGHVLIGYGQIAKVREFDVLGNAVYTAQFGASTGKSPVSSYRAYKHTWTATPHYQPRIVAESSGKLTNAYVSWNGATEVDHWTVYGGNSKTYMNELITVRKSGFETIVPLKTGVNYVRVEAKMGNSGLAMSEVTEVKKV